MNQQQIPLACVVISTNAVRQTQIGDWLRYSRHTTQLMAVDDAFALRALLAHQQFDIAIVVVDAANQKLPACLLQYPDLRVLVLTETRRIGPLPDWIHQGATDVASLHKLPAVHNSLRRMLEERALSKQVSALLEQNREQQKLIVALKSAPAGLPDQTHQFRMQRVRNKGKQARLIQIGGRKQAANRQFNVNATITDSVTGLPTRESVLCRFQQLLQSGPNSKRYTALLVQLATKADSCNSEGAQRTQQDLTIYRAANVLQHNFRNNSLMGRVSQNALLLIQPATATVTSRVVANRIRELLGNIGGVIDSHKDLHINTLNLAATTLSAVEVIARLEQRLKPGR